MRRGFHLVSTSAVSPERFVRSGVKGGSAKAYSVPSLPHVQITTVIIREVYSVLNISKALNRASFTFLLPAIELVIPVRER